MPRAWSKIRHSTTNAEFLPLSSVGANSRRQPVSQLWYGLRTRILGYARRWAVAFCACLSSTVSPEVSSEVSPEIRPGLASLRTAIKTLCDVVAQTDHSRSSDSGLESKEKTDTEPVSESDKVVYVCMRVIYVVLNSVDAAPCHSRRDIG